MVIQLLKNPDTLEVILNKYEKYNKEELKSNDELSQITYVNHANYTKHFRVWFDKKYGKLKINKLTTQHIKEYTLHRKRKGLKPNTIKNDLTYLRTFFKWVVRRIIFRIIHLTTKSKCQISTSSNG